ncbi:uncharacterized protein ARMOST_17233 [Armillaria ostoyae]|uniref:Uncharacterized protein n=1 Tax=Armillaria ostoyae TaxID=47428 RepID=A0A284RYE9_ARMOS|nr:uncharacterized protein ARMOST_17233 [Armillaria ostoyae]
MTPDELTITIVSAIGGACLLSLLVSLLNPPQTLPAHYVVPYVQPRPLVEPVGQIHTPTPQRWTTYVHSSSDEHLPPRNATPGPSNVPRTPPPAYDPTEAEEYGRFLWLVFRSPTPDLPLITIPDSPETPKQIFLSESNNEAPRPQTPFHRPSLPNTFPPGSISFDIPAHLCPLPDSDDESDSSDFGENEPVAEREDDDPLNPHGPDYEWPELDAVDRAFLGPYRSQAWERTEPRWPTTSPSPEVPQFPIEGGTQPSECGYMLTNSGRSIPPQPEARSSTHSQGPMRSSAPSPTYSLPSHWQRETAPISTAPPDFDNFNQDPETFGWADEEEEEDTALNYGDYRGYTSAPHFYYQPFPLPDSPTYAGQYQNHPPVQHHAQRIQGYRPPSYGTHLFAGQNSPPRPSGSNDPPTDPPRPSNEERLLQAREKLKLQD